MQLTDKLAALLAGKESLIHTANLPENLRSYSLQQRIEDADKLILDLLKEIIKTETITNVETTPKPAPRVDNDIHF